MASRNGDIVAPGKRLSALVNHQIVPKVDQLLDGLSRQCYQYEDGAVEEIPTPDQDARGRNPSMGNPVFPLVRMGD